MNVMVRAWEIARDAQSNFGGKVKEYFSQALVMAWAETKSPATRTWIDRVRETLTTDCVSIKPVQLINNQPLDADFEVTMSDGNSFYLSVQGSTIKHWSGYCWEYYDVMPE